MLQENYEKIIDLLCVKLIKINHIQVLHPITLSDYTNTNNKFIFVHQGTLTLKQHRKTITLKKGELLFIPEGMTSSVTYGRQSATLLDKNRFIEVQEKYIQSIAHPSQATQSTVFSYINFDVKVHASIDFFKFLTIAAFKIRHNTKLQQLIHSILAEDLNTSLGTEHMLKAYTLQLTIILIRHLITQRLFIEQIVLKSGLLTDSSLVALYTYIANNLEADLSNEALAKHIGLSKDYIGQYFKKLTSFNLQECVEIMRLKKAIELLKTTNMKISDISTACGYKAMSYFCKKFKLLWGTTANKVRKKALHT